MFARHARRGFGASMISNVTPSFIQARDHIFARNVAAASPEEMPWLDIIKGKAVVLAGEPVWAALEETTISGKDHKADMAVMIVWMGSCIPEIPRRMSTIWMKTVRLQRRGGD